MWTYILIMGSVCYLIRVLPLVLIRRPIQNVFLKSFLYYVPYVTLAVMTFPAILHATQSLISGWIALIVGMFMAYKEASLFKVAFTCCLLVFLLELFV